MGKLTQVVSIPVYVKTDVGFSTQSQKDYVISYCKTSNIKYFEIVVNGKMSGVRVNVMAQTNAFKPFILEAISRFEHGLLDSIPTTNKGLMLEHIQAVYPKNVVRVIKNHLLTINSEKRRDMLTEYNLIGLNNKQ